MREVLSRLMIRIVYCTIPSLLVADLSRAIGKSVSGTCLAFGIALPIVGLVADIVRVRQSRSATGGKSDPFDSAGKRPFQFSLRTLLLLMLVASIYCSFRFSGAVRQKRIVTELRAAGAPITYDQQSASWLGILFGQEMFGTVKTVTLQTDGEVAKLAALSGVTEVVLWSPGITDASIEALVAKPQLRKITLHNDTNMTPAGISKLRQSRPNLDVNVYGP
jgi:hypothetical protein